MKNVLDSKNLTKLATLLLAFFLASSVYGAKTKPVVDSVSPISGPSLGGTLVVVSGSNFADGAVVNFDGFAAQTEWVSDTTLNVITPFTAKGSATVSVTNQNGDSGKLINAFEFIHPGDGIFVDQPSNIPTDIYYEEEWDADAGDIDGDGDLDYVKAVYWAPSVGLYQNDGSGNFTDISTNVPSIDNRSASINLGDFDGDKDLDIFVSGYSKQDQLYLNNGDNPPTFVDATANIPVGLTGSWGSCLGDLNKDGHLDIYVANSGADSLYLNNGDIPPTFTDASNLLPTNNIEYHEDCTIADVNGDGWDDIYIAGYNQNSLLYINNQNTTVSLRNATLPNQIYSGAREIALVDIDKDGDLDAVTANHNSDQNALFINTGNVNGDPVFVDYTSNLPQILDYTHDVKAGDVDGDGDVDLVFANEMGPSKLFLNNGETLPAIPTFSEASPNNWPSDTSDSWDVILGDFDNDYDLDIIFSNCGQQEQFYLNTP